MDDAQHYIEDIAVDYTGNVTAIKSDGSVYHLPTTEISADVSNALVMNPDGLYVAEPQDTANILTIAEVVSLIDDSTADLRERYDEIMGLNEDLQNSVYALQDQVQDLHTEVGEMHS